MITPTREVSTYLREIEDADWIQEAIMERFDNAIELMSPNTVVYGGAVRDGLSGKDLLGDLDLSVPSCELDRVHGSFEKNPKWIRLSGDETSNGYQDTLISRIKISTSSVITFKTFGDKLVQLVISKYGDRDPLQNAIYRARTVDIVCCGVVMLSDGRVFEAVPGAYQDCIDGVLRINPGITAIFVDALKQRIDKLTQRGWKSLIDIPRVIKDMEKQKEKEKKKAQRLLKLSKQNSIGSVLGTGRILPDTKGVYFNFSGKASVPARGGFMAEVDKHTIDNFFKSSVDRCADAIRQAAEISGEDVRIKLSQNGSIFYETRNGHSSYKVNKNFDAILNRIINEENVIAAKARKSPPVVNTIISSDPFGGTTISYDSSSTINATTSAGYIWPSGWSTSSST